MHYCWSRRGIWPGFKGKYRASLGSLIPRFKTPLFWVISLTPTRTALDEDGQRRKHPVRKGRFLPSPQLHASSNYDIAIAFPLRCLVAVCSIKARGGVVVGGTVGFFFFFSLLVASETDTPPAHSTQP